jgi:hypothetical protein
MKIEIDRIIVHGGRAHRDEFLAVGLVAQITSSLPLVFRRNPTSIEIEHPHVWVLDVGREYEPDKRNFDHHQLDHKEDCTFSLVAKNFKYVTGVTYHELWAGAPWYRCVIAQDNIGQEGMSELYDIPRNEITAISAVESYVLGEFAAGGESVAVDPQWVGFARSLIAQKAVSAAELVATLAKINTQAKMLSVRVNGQDMPVFYGPNLEPYGVSAWLDRGKIPAVATVTLNPRGGVCLYRTDLGRNLLDFRQCANSAHAMFVHTAGHMMVVRAGLTRDDHISLLKAAILEKQAVGS